MYNVLLALSASLTTLGTLVSPTPLSDPPPTTGRGGGDGGVLGIAVGVSVLAILVLIGIVVLAIFVAVRKRRSYKHTLPREAQGPAVLPIENITYDGEF